MVKLGAAAMLLALLAMPVGDAGGAVAAGEGARAVDPAAERVTGRDTGDLSADIVRRRPGAKARQLKPARRRPGAWARRREPERHRTVSERKHTCIQSENTASSA